MESHKDYCIIKDMANLSSKEFDCSLRKIFLLIQQMGEDTRYSIKENNHELISHIQDIDVNIDRFHDYCVRVLNKTRFKEGNSAVLLFSSLYLLELLADEYKHIAFHILQDFKGKKLDNLLELQEITHEQFNKFYELFYKYSKEKLI